MFNWKTSFLVLLFFGIFSINNVEAAFFGSSSVPEGWFKSALNQVFYFTEEVKAKVAGVIDSFEKWLELQADGFAQTTSIFWQILFAFLAGLSVSLTPCIYPLIPITIGILSSRGQAGTKRQIARSLFYLLGVSLVFASLGFLALKFNLMFGSWLGNKWVIIFIVSVFTFLALTMLDLVDFDISFFEIKTPEVSSIFSAFFYGMITGLVASPCMTPALLTLLGFIAQKNDPILGFVLLFAFSLGMTFLVILFSSFSHLLLLMPKPGMWMVEFRHILGFGILFLCVSFLQPIISVWQYYLLLSAVWFFVGLYYFSSSKKESISKIIVAHRNKVEQEGRDALDIGFSEFITFSFLWKKLFSFLAIFLGIYCFGKSYLVYNRTKLRTVLIRLLK